MREGGYMEERIREDGKNGAIQNFLTLIFWFQYKRSNMKESLSTLVHVAQEKEKN